MWIQVRTIDGTETQTIEDLSRLTKIECLREKIEETFRVSPDRQRLFYRGKQVRRECPTRAGPRGSPLIPGPFSLCGSGVPVSTHVPFCELLLLFTPGSGGKGGPGKPALTECCGTPVVPDEVKTPGSEAPHPSPGAGETLLCVCFPT